MVSFHTTDVHGCKSPSSYRQRKPVAFPCSEKWRQHSHALATPGIWSTGLNLSGLKIHFWFLRFAAGNKVWITRHNEKIRYCASLLLWIHFWWRHGISWPRVFSTGLYKLRIAALKQQFSLKYYRYVVRWASLSQWLETTSIQFDTETANQLRGCLVNFPFLKKKKIIPKPR